MVNVIEGGGREREKKEGSSGSKGTEKGGRRNVY